MRLNFVINSLQRTQRELFDNQSQIATGRRFLTPSDDPIAATRALDLTQALARQEQFVTNVQHGDNFLASADSALTEVNDLLIQASVIASQTVGNLTSRDERESEAVVVAAIRQQLQSVGNRQFDGRYIFGGRETLDRPFIDTLGGVAYVGDMGNLLTRVDDGVTSTINMTGDRVFDALSQSIATDVDLSPVLSETTRLDNLAGANGHGIERGTIVFNEPTGAGAFTVDLSSADTIGDIVALIDSAAASAGSSLTATLSDSGLTIMPGAAPVSITDTSAGLVVASLGIATIEPTSTAVEGINLQPRIARLTPIADLAGGAGIDTDTGMIITNGGETATIDLSDAETVQDLINIINNAGVGVLARIDDAGTRIDVLNQVSGTSLAIGENGGTTATDLGLRTFDTATPLEALNFGRGVSAIEGENDLRITTRDGSTVDVNLDGAVTIGDVIDLINEAATDAGVTVTAAFADTGNGIVLQDSTSGSNALSVGALNVSSAASDLGLVQSVTDPSADLLGADVNAVRTDGILDALIELEKALLADDTQGISAAGGRLDTLRNKVTRIHGIVGARSQSMGAKRRQIEDSALLAQTFLSEVKDLDYAEAITRLQGSLTQLQANMQTSSNLLGLSLMDFLR
jgi:flagellar hook-associated protein 3 FlgL